DFNNILATMALNLELAKLETSDTAMWTLLDDTESAVIQAQSLTSQIVAFAPGDSAQVEPADLNDLLEPVCRFAARGLKVTIDLQCDPGLPSVAIDAHQMAHVIHNLIRNANTAMPEGGILSIQGFAENDMVVVRFTDQGIGIPNSDLAKIFDPWFTSSTEGAGLGLAVVHSVMQQHGGDITVKSEVGKGSVFTLRLPVFTGTQDDERAAAPDELLNLNVLIMDDNVAVIKALVQLTASMGCDISECDDGSAAFELWSRARDLGQAFDILILDIEVPGGTGGVETLRQIHQIDPGARAIAISGYSSEGVISHPEHYGFSAALKKPFTKASLHRVLHELA
ncbi:MAG: hybrid sensor histidine kinase/response regulator, partial [Gammaproteobacteria bacterium]